MKNGLFIPISLLVNASGISESTIKKDVKNSVLSADSQGYIWYRDAITYVFEKWESGKTEMYNPYCDDNKNSFASRVLDMIDDEIAVDHLSAEWKDKK